MYDEDYLRLFSRPGTTGWCCTPELDEMSRQRALTGQNTRCVRRYQRKCWGGGRFEAAVHRWCVGRRRGRGRDGGGRPGDRGSRLPPSPTPAPRTHCAPIEAAAGRRRTGRTRHPGRAARSCAAPTRSSSTAPDDLALLMTTEMGKPLAEAKGEVAYAAEFFRWFSEEAVRIGGGFATTADGKNRILVSREPVGPCVLDHPVELPARHGHPQDRSRHRGRLHSRVQACQPQLRLSSLALVDILVEAGLPGGVVNVVCTTKASSVVSPLDASGIARKISLHGFDRGGRPSARAGVPARHALVHGARRQRPIDCLRGRRPRSCCGRGVRGQDAQHG